MDKTSLAVSFLKPPEDSLEEQIFRTHTYMDAQEGPIQSFMHLRECVWGIKMWSHGPPADDTLDLRWVVEAEMPFNV